MSSHYKRMSYEQPMNKSRTNINIAPTASKYPIVNSKSKSKGKINNSSLKPNQIKISNQPKLDNNRKQTSPIKTNSTSIDINHKSLQFNIDDNYESLVNKNSNLRQKLVEAQEIIHSLNLKNKMLIEQQEKEKEEIFQELNRIGKNYKIYAESHKKLLEQEKEQNSSKTEEKDHNYELIKLYQDNISLYLIDYMAMLHKTVQHLTTHKNTNSHLRFEQFKKTNSLSQYSNLFVYGRSLGETSSILLTSNLSNKEMCDIVMMRGLITEEESKLNDGKMMNIIGDSNKIIEILNEYIKSNNVSDFTIAGIHSKRLVVLSGNKDSLNKVAFLKDRIKVTIKDLNVQGAFHSNLMNNAQLRFHDYLNDKNHNFAISCSTYKRLTTVSKYRSLDINNNSNHIRTLMSNTLIEPYDTNTLFTILRDESIETFDLSMNSYLKYNDYI